MQTNLEYYRNTVYGGGGPKTEKIKLDDVACDIQQVIKDRKEVQFYLRLDKQLCLSTPDESPFVDPNSKQLYYYYSMCSKYERAFYSNY